ncbi:putative E3 ubiquitin-protein ligase RNF217 [Camellia lanceoleosa]|uniref:E3 ubiquitin-protein ligase RNF217 n=1 Tax=Camellia lanceoleosa TaxID=1840588 RepID=A0ACC0HW00_9ERIC|nr:putative E3 ubiquitin-protein ligase RNF217 [Camellia lanceoleosa]
MKMATPNSKSRPISIRCSTVSPAEIVDLADDEENENENENDEISLLYATTKNKDGTNANNAISVEHYSDHRDLQLAIMASLLPHTHTHTHTPPRKRRIIDIDLSLFPDNDDDDDDDIQVLDSSWSSSLFRKQFRGGPSITEQGQSSKSKSETETETITFMCEICVEPKPLSDSFSIMGCTHSYCSDCILKFVASKLQDNITQIQCPVPDCNGLLDPEHCRPILPPDVFDRWGTALCEAVILSSHKFYCPYKDCSALLIDDGGEAGEQEVITQSECPNCRRLFCAQCKVPWHSGIECAEFQKLNKDEREKEDIMLIQLAKKNKWIRCPKCKFYVEKSQGCLFMMCRCGHTFCYNCGSPLIAHYCSKCKH